MNSSQTIFINFYKKDDLSSWETKGNFEAKLYLVSAWNYEISENHFAITVNGEGRR